MSTFYDEESGSYKNFENEVIYLLKAIAGGEEENQVQTENSSEEEQGE